MVGPIEKCYCKELSQIVQGSKWAKKIGQKVPKKAKKSQNTFHLISTVRKLLDQSKNVTVRTYHKLSKDQNEQKKWPKSIKKCQKEPKYV